MKRPLHARLMRSVYVAVAPLFASACFIACSGGTGGAGETGAASEATGTASEAISSVGILHSHVTRSSMHRNPTLHCGGFDTGHGCHPRPFDLCPLFDNEFLGEDGGPSCAHVTTPSCPDRVDTWDDLFVIDFAIAVTGDCRFGQWGPPLLSDTDVANYLNDLLGFTLQFMGCPDEGTTTPLTYGLIPSALAGDRFTTADLNALNDAFIAAVQQGLSDSGLPALTDKQVREMHLTLDKLASRVPNVKHSRKFTFSTCTDGGDDMGVDRPDDFDCDRDDR
jgi:hypothetical protein